MVLAHGSGIDELLVMGVPVALIALALVVADRRAKARLARDGDPEAPGDDEN